MQIRTLKQNSIKLTSIVFWGWFENFGVTLIIISYQWYLEKTYLIFYIPVLMSAWAVVERGCCEAIHLFEAVTSPKTESRKKGGGESAHFSILTKSEARRVLGNVTRLCTICCCMDALIFCKLNISDIGYQIWSEMCYWL